MRRLAGLLLSVILLSAQPAEAGYADLADLALAAPVIAHATVTKAEGLSEKEAPGIPAGRARLLVSARVGTVLVAPADVPADLSWIWDAPLDARGKAPKPKGLDALVFLGPVAADGKTRLIAGNAQRPYDPAEEATVRAILAEQRSGHVPVFTGVANGFHTAGTVPAEGESQFFLTTAGGGTVTMVVTTRPGEPRRVAVARGDIIDESAAPVKRDTLLWYRLACSLPRTLPSGIGSGDAALAGDYAAAIATLGPCGRTGA
jgi:hypothetical protein